MIKEKVKCLIFFLGINFSFLPSYLKLAIKNRRFWKKHFKYPVSGSNIIVVEICDKVFSTFCIASLAFLIGKFHKSRIIFIGGNCPSHISLLLKSFPNTIIKKIDPIPDQGITQRVQSLLNSCTTSEDLLKMEYNGFLIGELVYDLIMRKGQWQATVWKIDDKANAVLTEFFQYFALIDKLQKNHEIKSAVFSHSIGLGGAVINYLVSKKIPCYSGVMGYGPIRNYRRLHNKKLEYIGLVHPDIIYNIEQDEYKKKIYIEKAEEFLKERLKGDTKNKDAARAFSNNKKEYHDPVEFCNEYNLDPAKPLIFVMLHAFNDFPHHFNLKLFNDYYRWFLETLKISKTLDSVNWIFKQHPSSNDYPDDANLAGLFELITNKNILYLDKDSSFNGNSIAQIGHAVITCVGTAGLEFSCFGVPCVLGGENYYSQLNLAYLPKNFEDYKSALSKIHQIDRLSQQQMDRAKILHFLQLVFISGFNENNSFIEDISIQDLMDENKGIGISKIINSLDEKKFHNLSNHIYDFISDDYRELFIQDKDLSDIEKQVNIRKINDEETV